MYSPMYASTTSSVDESTSAASTPTFMDISNSFWMDPMSLEQQHQELVYDPSLECYYMVNLQSSTERYYDGQTGGATPSMMSCPPPPLSSDYLPLSPPEYHYHLPLQPVCQPSITDGLIHHVNSSTSPDTKDGGPLRATATANTAPVDTEPHRHIVRGVSTVADARPYACCACSRAFARKHDLQRHIRVHTGDKPYACVCCKKSFARTDALKRHLRMEDQCRLSPEVQAMKFAGKRRYRNL